MRKLYGLHYASFDASSWLFCILCWQDSFVLCRIFRKSGSGPKNGEQYGAPFVEEEWEDDELVMVPKQEFAEDFPVDDDDAYLDANDLEQV